VIAERVRSEAREVRDFVREIGVPDLAVFSEVPLGHDRREHRFDSTVAERLHVDHPLQLAMEAKYRRLANPEMQVRGTGIDERAKQAVDLCSRRL
jgi:hypothetical protein